MELYDCDTVVTDFFGKQAENTAFGWLFRFFGLVGLSLLVFTG